MPISLTPSQRSHKGQAVPKTRDKHDLPIRCMTVGFCFICGLYLLLFFKECSSLVHVASQKFFIVTLRTRTFRFLHQNIALIGRFSAAVQINY